MEEPVCTHTYDLTMLVNCPGASEAVQTFFSKSTRPPKKLAAASGH